MTEIEKLEVEEEKTDNKFEEVKKEPKVSHQTLNNPVLEVEENAAIESKYISVSNGNNDAKIPTNDREEIKSSLWESDSNVRIGVLVVVAIFFILVYVGIKETNRNNYDNSSYPVDTTMSTMSVDTAATIEYMEADTTSK
jgi:hypothetical protein